MEIMPGNLPPLHPIIANNAPGCIEIFPNNGNEKISLEFATIIREVKLKAKTVGVGVHLEVGSYESGHSR